MVATGAVARGHPLPLLSLMSTVACASSSSEMRSRLPPRAAWCRAENLRHKVGLSPASSHTVLSPQPPLHTGTWAEGWDCHWLFMAMSSLIPHSQCLIPHNKTLINPSKLPML